MSARTTLTVEDQVWPLKAVFRIAHGARTEARVVGVDLDDGQHRGRGECVPYPRYGESPASVIAQIEAIRPDLEAGAGRDAVQHLLPPGAARNAVDCALWELDARRAGVRVWELAGLPAPGPVTTAYTIALDTPEAMAASARAAALYPLLKVKIGGAGDLDRVAAVALARPDARLIVDANEGLDAESLPRLLDQARDWRIEVIEQPFGSPDDRRLSRIAAPVAICADESFHVAADIETVIAGYDAVNVKLDKAGGLTEAIKAVHAAREAGLKVMVGCMVGSSLGAAPAALLAGLADWVDLDGPLLLASDRPVPLVYHGALLQPADRQTWG
jgi:L-Ala-D/L-Glu epimerase